MGDLDDRNGLVWHQTETQFIFKIIYKQTYQSHLLTKLWETQKSVVQLIEKLKKKNYRVSDYRKQR